MRPSPARRPPARAEHAGGGVTTGAPDAAVAAASRLGFSIPSDGCRGTTAPSARPAMYGLGRATRTPRASLALSARAILVERHSPANTRRGAFANPRGGGPRVGASSAGTAPAITSAATAMASGSDQSSRQCERPARQPTTSFPVGAIRATTTASWQVPDITGAVLARTRFATARGSGCRAPVPPRPSPRRPGRWRRARPTPRGNASAPPQRTTSIPAGAIPATTAASWPAPRGYRRGAYADPRGGGVRVGASSASTASAKTSAPRAMASGSAHSSGQ